MHKLIKQILKEAVDEQMKSDIQMIIDEGLVDMEVYPDLTYVDLEQLRSIFPDNNIARPLKSLGYGCFRYDSDGVKAYFIAEFKYHNINGPAVIYGNDMRSWYVNDKLTAASSEFGKLRIVSQYLWNKYFAKNYKQPINESKSKRYLKEESQIKEVLRDVKWAIEEQLVDMEAYPDITYVNLGELRSIFPDKPVSSALLKSLGYGEIYYDSEGNKSYFNLFNINHNINGPAWIKPNGTKYWYIEGTYVAKSFNNELHIIDDLLWNKYFRDSYKP